MARVSLAPGRKLSPVNTPSKPSPLRTSSTSSSPSRSSPASLDASSAGHIPTSLELILFLFYLGTVILGIVSSFFETSSTYSHVLQAHTPETAPSYFALKNNFFNQVFVKRGWLWTSLAFFVFLFTTHPPRPSSATAPSQPAFTATKAKALARWAVITFWWVIVTQWFFGPPIMDRGFTLTGGKCALPVTENGSVEEIVYSTSTECRHHDGRWIGGHDLSGHIFLLTMGSLMLVFEALPFLGSKSDSTRESAGAGSGFTKTLGGKVVLALVALWWWMLLMTAVFFHTWPEKVSSLQILSTQRLR
jgi:hypothetical protein